MNERIEKLAEQAGMIVDKYGLARDAENGLEDGVDIYKFAELIVRECANIVQDSPWQLPQGYKSVDQAKLVKKYFGVEE